jgi:hypothetical protein
MRHIKYAYEEAARKAATVCHVDEAQRKAFLAGVAWAAEDFCNQLRPSHWESHPGYPKKFLDELTLKDFRKTLEAFCKAEQVED